MKPFVLGKVRPCFFMWRTRAGPSQSRTSSQGTSSSQKPMSSLAILERAPVANCQGGMPKKALAAFHENETTYSVVETFSTLSPSLKSRNVSFTSFSFCAFGFPQ